MVDRSAPDEPLPLELEPPLLVEEPPLDPVVEPLLELDPAGPPSSLVPPPLLLEGPPLEPPPLDVLPPLEPSPFEPDGLLLPEQATDMAVSETKKAARFCAHVTLPFVRRAM